LIFDEWSYEVGVGRQGQKYFVFQATLILIKVPIDAL
jgi:hypothetical protein